FRFGLCFGLFQFFMPLAGYLMAGTLKEQVQKYDYIVAFILLNSVGLDMIFSKSDGDDGYNNNYDDGGGKNKLNEFKQLITLGIATSIDAFAVGISFYALKINIIKACITIGIVAFIMSFLGIYIGNKLGERLEEKFSSHTEKLGGFILIFIAFKVLINKFI
ncbi:MAG: manganese efflux pump MntP family protein, partial [bacterium]